MRVLDKAQSDLSALGSEGHDAAALRCRRRSDHLDQVDVAEENPHGGD